MTNRLGITRVKMQQQTRRHRTTTKRRQQFFSRTSPRHRVSPYVPRRQEELELHKSTQLSALTVAKNSKENSYVPCNMFIGSNFTARLHNYFQFAKLVGDNKTGGIIHFDFSALRTFEQMDLSASAIKLLTVPNAGGNSVISEVLSFEFLQKCFNSTLVKTEMEVAYFPEGGSMTDYVCNIFGTKMGVSVTRAIKFFGEYTEEDASNLLTKKLKGVNQSNKNSMEKWEKQILHVWTKNKDVANTVIKIYNTLSEQIKSNTVVVVTTARRSGFIFANK